MALFSPASARLPRAERAGMTLVELTVVTAILFVALSFFSATVVATARQRSIHRENAIAAEAARSVVETMRDVAFEEVWARYNEDPLDDPDGPGSAPGSRFPVAGLSPIDAAPGALVGRVRFPAVNVGTQQAPIWQLREDVDDRTLGMPRDLDGDHVVDELDHGDDYFRLPVAVDLEWVGDAGPRRLSLFSMLCQFDYAEL